MKQKVVSIVLSLALLLLLASDGMRLSVNAIIPVEDALVAEEKVYCNATLDDAFADNRIMIVLNNAASTSLNRYTTSDFASIGCTNVTNLTSTATELIEAKILGKKASEFAKTSTIAISPDDYSGATIETFHQVLCLEIANVGKANVLNAIKLLEQREDILYAGPDYVLTAFSVEVNDTYVDNQWAIDKIQLPEAWEFVPEDNITVGILDTGIDGDHPDLVEMISVEGSFDCTGTLSSGVAEVVDVFGHGTSVAGIVAAQTNNGLGIAGVCDVTLVSLQVFESSGHGYSSYVANAIDIANLFDIPILNFSGGYLGGDDNPQYDLALDTVIDSYDGLFVCAAGNENFNNDEIAVYPANYSIDNMITVGASTANDEKCECSNYGATTVDIFAPGDNILTCYPKDRCDGNSCGILTSHTNGYHYDSGTSFAAPYVTGVAALLKLQNPDWSAVEIKTRILSTVDVVYDSNGNNVFGGLCVSGGRLNAFAALHSHRYTCTKVNSTQHRCVCACGYSMLENHQWKTRPSLGVGFGPIFIITYCESCGYET